MSIFPYPVCHQTVTVYRKEGGTVTRRVAYGCYYRFEDHLLEDAQGLRFVRKFLLIQPGKEKILPGDRIVEGIGPNVDVSQWDKFEPACVPGLSQVAYVAPWHWEGEIQHIEAGRK